MCDGTGRKLKYGDVVVLYRTAEDGKHAEYSAVATSVCVVESVKRQDEFGCFDDFMNMHVNTVF